MENQNQKTPVEIKYKWLIFKLLQRPWPIVNEKQNQDGLIEMSLGSPKISKKVSESFHNPAASFYYNDPRQY